MSYVELSHEAIDERVDKIRMRFSPHAQFKRADYEGMARRELELEQVGERESKRNRARLKKERQELLANLRPKRDPILKDVRKTSMGTPCSPQWDDDWIDLVDETEVRLEHRCCGAHAPDEMPCELEASSKNGRCRIHGGGLKSGAQKGNTNAMIHGLYSRRLQRCGSHCPLWEVCPYSGKDVQTLEPHKRPACFFGTEELDALRKLDATAHPDYKPLENRDLDELKADPYPMHAQLIGLRENLNMLQIMITRAARALSVNKLSVGHYHHKGTQYSAHEKTSALLQAHKMLMREYRLLMNTYDRFVQHWGLPKYARP